MPSTPVEVFLPKIQCTQFGQVFLAHASEFIQQLAERFSLALSYLSQTIKFLKRPGLAELQHHPRPRHPIRALGVNQVPDDIVGVPGISPFISKRPSFGEITQ